ncbi:MAG: hypothetical protein HC880_20365, partial [Bacteroidia bacterium]|nr:hypothetical protein [Bacteroidia bacterium]
MQKSFVVIFYLIAAVMNACHDPLEPEPSPREEPMVLQDELLANSTNLNDSIERPSILGVKLPNPYLLPNMRQAYTRVKGGTWSSLAASHKYVRFRPTDVNQLVTLEETLDLELFDEPLDYQIIQEGDYYQDPAIPAEQITWQYAVVPVNFSFPARISYELLASIHIPDDTFVEAEAERLVGLND